MINLFSVVLVLLSCGSSAFATNLEFSNGRYTENQRDGEAIGQSGFLLRKNGSHVELFDRGASIAYQGDLDSTSPQSLPPDYLALLRRKPGTHVLGQVIKNIAIADIAQNSANQIRANIIVTMETNSQFGHMQAALKIGVTVSSDKCPVTDESFSSKTGYAATSRIASCLTYETGTSMELASISTGLGQSVDQAVGILADLMFKVLTPYFTQSQTVYQHV